MEISILNTGENTALENMRIDEVLLKNLSSDEKPKLHLYSWLGDCATYGHFAKPEKFLNIDRVQKKRLQLAKRVTGGGITFHFSDYAFSFFMPKGHPYFSENTLENYHFVNQFVLMAIEEYIDEREKLHFFNPCTPHDPMAQQFCMAKPTKYDVLYKGKKVGGAAQRKTNNGYLHHGTISIAMPDLNYLKEILISEEVYNAICQNSFYLVENHLDKEQLNCYRKKIEKKLIESFLNFVG